MQKRTYIFDLDDTLIPTHLHPEWKEGDYASLFFSETVVKMLERVGKENAILLTFDRYGDQRKKLKHLQVENSFKEIIVVDEKIKKRGELLKLKEKNLNMIVVGDRYNEGELIHAEELGIPTICVAMQGGIHYDSSHHHKHLFLVENENDFLKLPI